MNKKIFKYLLRSIPRENLGWGKYNSKINGAEKWALVNNVTNEVLFLSSKLSKELVRQNYDQLAVYELDNEKNTLVVMFPDEALSSNKISLTKEQLSQLFEYIYIFKSNNFTKHWQVNEKISANDDWDKFDEIRALNDHGYEEKIKGILPHYFQLVCYILKISGDEGAKLIDSEPY
jgi:hypothetical protein